MGDYLKSKGLIYECQQWGNPDYCTHIKIDGKYYSIDGAYKYLKELIESQS